MQPTGTGPSPVPAGQVWKLCYSSDTMANTVAELHSRCDPHNITLTVADNSLKDGYSLYLRTRFFSTQNVGPGTSGTLGRPASLVGVTFGGFVSSLQTTCPQLSCVPPVLCVDKGVLVQIVWVATGSTGWW